MDGTRQLLGDPSVSQAELAQASSFCLPGTYVSDPEKFRAPRERTAPRLRLSFQKRAKRGDPVDATALQTAPAPAAGRSAVLEDWVQDYGDAVLHLAYLYLKDRGAAEDVFQETFLKAYTHMDGFRGEASARTWLCRIAVNLCRDRLRGSYLRRVVLAGQEFLASRDPLAPDVSEAVFARTDSAVLMEAVLQLPLAFREVVLLHYWQELTTVEVGAVLGLAEGTVRSRLHRARARLKEILEEGGALR